VELSIGTTDTPLTLGNILNHFWPETHIIPEPLSKVTDEVGLTEFLFRTGHDGPEKGHIVKMVKLGLGITSTRVELMGMSSPYKAPSFSNHITDMLLLYLTEGMTLMEPTLDLSVYNPFDHASRMFMIKFGAMVMIDEYIVSVKVGVAAGTLPPSA